MSTRARPFSNANSLWFTDGNAATVGQSHAVSVFHRIAQEVHSGSSVPATAMRALFCILTSAPPFDAHAARWSWCNAVRACLSVDAGVPIEVEVADCIPILLRLLHTVEDSEGLATLTDLMCSCATVTALAQQVSGSVRLSGIPICSTRPHAPLPHRSFVLYALGYPATHTCA